MLKLPHAVVPYVLIIVRCCPPDGLVPIRVGTGLEQIPGASGCITVHCDNRAENMMDGKRDTLA